METHTLSQLRRLVFRWKDTPTGNWNVYNVEPENIGQDDIITFSASPRMIERAASTGTTSKPIPGTIEEMTASITILADTAAIIGRILGNWTPSTYAGASSSAGRMIIGGADADVCTGNRLVSVVAQGICDGGSETDVEIARCYPQIDGDIAIGTSETPSVTFQLNPQRYNALTDANDGYEPYSIRLGDYSSTQKMRLNAVTGEYEAVTASN